MGAHAPGRFLTGTLLLLALLSQAKASSALASDYGLYKNGEKILDLTPADTSGLADMPEVRQALRQIEKENLTLSQSAADRPYRAITKSYVTLGRQLRSLVKQFVVEDADERPVQDALRDLAEVAGRFVLARQAVIARMEQLEYDLIAANYSPEKILVHQTHLRRTREVGQPLVVLLSDFIDACNDNDQVPARGLVDQIAAYLNDNTHSQEEQEIRSKTVPVKMELIPAPVFPAPPAWEKESPPGSAAAVAVGFDPADLLETIEVQFTDDIISLAAELDHSPAKMYEYVRNNYRFEPYTGSRKGAQQTLLQGGGNDFDLASLLIALLRSSGIPARYAVADTVRLTLDQATRWLRCPDAWNAGSILTTAGMEGIVWTVGGNPYFITCRRVLVQAYLPYSNYRGAVNDSTGFMWVPMDPAHKLHQIGASIDLPAEIGFDAGEFIDEYYAFLRAETPTEMFRRMLSDSLALYHPGAVFEDILPDHRVQLETDAIIPGTLPYDVLQMGTTYSEIPSDMRFEVRFRLHSFEYSSTVLDHTVVLPEIAGKSVTISFEGATPADQEILDTAGSAFNVDVPYLVQLQPVLRIDGCEVARGNNSVTMGRSGKSDMYFYPPTGAFNHIPVIYNDIVAGNYQGIGIDPEAVRPSLSMDPVQSCEENQMGWELYQTAVTYLNNVDQAQDEAAELLHIVLMNGVSEAIVENAVDVGIDPGSGNPISFDWTGLIVDADRKIVGSFSMYGNDNSCDLMTLGGADGSWQENLLFETKYDQEAISTIKILSIAGDSGIAVCTLTVNPPEAQCPGFSHSTSVRNAVMADLAAGKFVVIPERSFQYGDWTGSGWIAMDPVSCAAGYMIGGGHGGKSLDGGATVWVWPDPLSSWFLGRCTKAIGPIQVLPVSANDMYSANNGQLLTFIVPSMEYYGGPFGACNFLFSMSRVFTLPISIAAIASFWGPGDYVFRAGSDDPGCPSCGSILKLFTIVRIDIQQANLMLASTETSASLNLTGSYSPGGFIWSSTPPGISGSGEEISFDPSGLAPGVYTVRVTSVDMPNYFEELEVTIIKVDIEQVTENKCVDEAGSTLYLQDSFSPGGFAWSSTPPGISGSGPFVAYDPGSLSPGKYTVRAESVDLPSCFDECTVNIARVEIQQVGVLNCSDETNVLMNIIDSYAPYDYAWYSTPPGIAGGGAFIYYHPAGVTPGTYTVRAEAIDIPDCYDECTVDIIKVDIEQVTENKCVDETGATLYLQDSYSPGGFTWTSTPPGIAGSGPTVDYDPGSLTPGKYTVRAESVDLPGCFDECTVNIIRVEIQQVLVNECYTETNALLNVVNSYSPGDYTWSSTPPGISGSGTFITYNPSTVTPGTYTVRAESVDLPDCYDECVVNIIRVDILEGVVTHCRNVANATLELQLSYSPGGFIWTSVPPGIAGNGPTINYAPNGLAKGVYTVRAESVDDPACFDVCTVNILEIQKVQYLEPGGTWVDIGGTLHVRTGTTVIFRAIADPPVAWPAGAPVWGGTSLPDPTGETVAVTFNVTSATMVDFKIVTANCGNTKTINVVVYDLTGTLTPVDNFAGRSATDYGMEEEVVLDFTVVPAAMTPALGGGWEWGEHAGVGVVTNAGADGTADYDAMHTANTAELRLTINSGPSKGYLEYDRRVLAPSGTRMTRATANVRHDFGIASAGIGLFYWLSPVTVSFGFLTFGEGAAPATGATGIYVTVPPGDHGQNTFWGGILGGHSVNGSRVAGMDGAWTTRAPHAPGGTFLWSIPTHYIDDAGTRHAFGTNQDHSPTIEASGRTTMTKSGQSGSAELNDPTSGY